MLSGPLLTFENKNELTDTSAFSKLRHPRTAIGIKPNGKIILLTADGRQENAVGLSLPELAQVMRWLGCTTAINLDGGGSTTLWVASDSVKGIVNFPSDNKKWDHEGARKVANVILLKEKKRNKK
jgi:exopolysaccharide biosynthesis protein